MKKVLSTLMLAVSAAFFISCNSSSDFDDKGYSDVYPGIVMYDESKFAGMLALDGSSIAMKFAILQTEMAAKGLSFDDYPFGTQIADADWDKLGNYFYEPQNEEFTIKNYLFGNNDNVSIVQASQGVYHITYGTSEYTYTSAVYDQVGRRGTFVLDTKDLNLKETTSATAWSVSYLTGTEEGENDNMSYSVNGNYVSSSDLITDIYYDNGEFKMSFKVSSRYTSNSSNPNEWSGAASLTTTSSNLSFLGTVKSTYSFESDMSGVNIGGSYSLNYKTVSAIKYTPDSVPFRSVGGSEEVSLAVENVLFHYNTVTVNSLPSGYREVIYGPFVYSEE